MSKITAILGELEAQRRNLQNELGRLDSAIRALQGLGTKQSKKSGTSSGPRRIMSAAARKKIATAQRARWAAWRAKQAKAA